MKKYSKKIISAVAVIILLFGLISVYKNLTEDTKTKAQGTGTSSSGQGVGVDPFGSGVGTGVNPNSSGVGSGVGPGTNSSSGTGTNTGTTTTDTTGVSTGSCDIDPVCKPKEPTYPAWMTSFDKEKTVSESLKQSNIATAWALSLDVVNVLAIFMLLAIAFANILHIGEREMFSFKRMIPAFVIGLILANFSHLICRAIIDFAGMLMNFFVPKEHAVDVAANIYTGMYGGWTGAAAGGAIMFGTGAVTIVALFLGAGVIACGPILIGLIILGIPVLITLILWFLLVARTYVLWFLVILSPIAFFGMFFDPLKRTIGTWWNWFLMWTFMGPIAYFFIYLAEGFAKDTTGYNSVSGCFDPSNADQVGGFTKYLIVNVLLILAVYVPYALGNKIGMGLWAGIGKFLGGMGLWAGAGTGAAGLRAAGLKKVQNPLTLPALPRGMENSALGMLWQKKREADIGTTMRGIRKGISGNPLLRGLTKNLDEDTSTQMAKDFALGPRRGLTTGLKGSTPEHIKLTNLKAAGIKPIESEEEKRQAAWITQEFNRQMGVDVNQANTLQHKVTAGTATDDEKKELRSLTGKMFSFSDLFNPSSTFDDIEQKAKQKKHDPKKVRTVFNIIAEQASDDNYWQRISDESRPDKVDIHELFMNPDALPTRRSRSV